MERDEILKRAQCSIEDEASEQAQRIERSWELRGYATAAAVLVAIGAFLDLCFDGSFSLMYDTAAIVVFSGLLGRAIGQHKTALAAYRAYVQHPEDAPEDEAPEQPDRRLIGLLAATVILVSAHLLIMTVQLIGIL